MIAVWAYDVEILPNFFSITFVNVHSYLNEFKDCVDSKGKPITLTSKYKVSEIKEKLKNPTIRAFYITDKDDNMLYPMMEFINNLRAKTINGEHNRSDLFGYNNNSYDRLMIACLLMNFGNTNSTKELITKLYNTSKDIINSQKDNTTNEHFLKLLRDFKVPFVDIDIMRIFALNKCGSGVNDKGEKVYYGKSLKQTSINIQWYELLDYEMPPISDIDREYYIKNAEYRGYSNEQLNMLVDNWDRFILDEWIDEMMRYNTNDVLIVCEIMRLNMDEIKARYSITSNYKLNVLSNSRSTIAEKLFDKFYSEFSNLKPFQWKGRNTQRTILSFKRVIFDIIKFETPYMKDLLAELKKISITSVSKDAFSKTIVIGDTEYTMATGGLHSVDIPRELYSSDFKRRHSSTGENNDYNYIHFDVNSFYPYIMYVYGIAPAHLDKNVFVKLMEWLTLTRIKAKHSKEQLVDGVDKDVLALVLKIVINSIYGKLGYEYGDICDRLALISVTINGQLLLLMLIEKLEVNGIKVVSANTDGIVIKLYDKDKDLFNSIIKEWEDYTKLTGESEEYNCYINRDINNYIAQEKNTKTTYKGALNPYMHLVDLQKGYNSPIVAKAVSDFFLHDIPVLDTLRNSTNILDFCKTQNIGRQFTVSYVKNGVNQHVQRNVRYYISLNGGVLQKIDVNGRINRLAAGQTVTVLNSLDDDRIENRSIKYSYYYDECMKIIDPIKLSLRSNKAYNGKSGKSLIKKYSGSYNKLFDDEAFQ